MSDLTAEFRRRGKKPRQGSRGKRRYRRAVSSSWAWASPLLIGAAAAAIGTTGRLRGGGDLNEAGFRQGRMSVT